MTNPSNRSGDPAIAIPVPEPVPQLIHYTASDARLSALGSGFVRHVHHFVNRHKSRGDFPQPSDSQFEGSPYRVANEGQKLFFRF